MSEDDPVRIEGGEPVCWLQRVCPDCGALTEQPDTTCWRCGRPLEDAADESET